MLSREGKTARRLHGINSGETPEKRQMQIEALMKLFLSQNESWMCLDKPIIL